MSRVLVIGASGFIGLNVVDELLAQGYEVRATRRRSTPTMFLRARPVELVDASLEEPEKLRRAMHACDAVTLAAAYYPRYSRDREGSIEVGVRGVRNVCDAARAVGIQRLVFTSSIATLARPRDGQLACERDVAPSMPKDSTYRAVKWAMEREVEHARSLGLDVVTLLPGGCIGPWDVRLGVGGILVATMRGVLPWWTDGTVNLVDVHDVARAHVAALSPRALGRYCIGGHALSVRTLLETIVARYGGAMPKERLSAAEARARADLEEREAEPRRARAPVPREFVDMVTSGQPVSSTRALAELIDRFTPLESALERAHAWFVRFHYLPRHETNNDRSLHEHI